MDDKTLREIAKRYLFRQRIQDDDLSLFNKPILVEGKGTIVTDTNGKKYLDFNSGQMCATLGHNHPKIVKALEESARTLIHSNTYLLHVFQIEFISKMAEILDPPLSKIYLSLSGSDSSEIAVEIAKRYTGGYEVLAFDAAFHGLSQGARSLTFHAGRKGYGPFLPGIFAIPTPYCYRCPAELKAPDCDFMCLGWGFKNFDAQSAGAPAAFIAESILSSGGVIEVPPGYFPVLKKKCSERGILFILDEAQTGLGKLGTMFGYQQIGVMPDILTLSKHLGGGIPVSAIITSPEIEEKVAAKGFVSTRSHAADPISCAAGTASIEIILEEDMVAKAQHIGQYFKDLLWNLKEKSRIVGDVRGRGTLWGAEIVKDKKTKEPGNKEAERIVIGCLKKGLIIDFKGAYGNCNILRIVPPFCTTDEQLERAAGILGSVIREVEASL